MVFWPLFQEWFSDLEVEGIFKVIMYRNYWNSCENWNIFVMIAIITTWNRDSLNSRFYGSNVLWLPKNSKFLFLNLNSRNIIFIPLTFSFLFIHCSTLYYRVDICITKQTLFVYLCLKTPNKRLSLFFSSFPRKNDKKCIEIKAQKATKGFLLFDLFYFSFTLFI